MNWLGNVMQDYAIWQSNNTVGVSRDASRETFTMQLIIDMAIVSPAMNFTQQNKPEADLDDLMFPMRFDVQLHHSVRNEEWLEHISRVGIMKIL